MLPSVVVAPGRVRLYLDYIPDELLRDEARADPNATFAIVDVTPEGSTLVGTVGCSLAAALDPLGRQYFLCDAPGAAGRAVTVQRLSDAGRLEPVLPAPVALSEDAPLQPLTLAVPPSGTPIVIYRERSPGPPDDGGSYAQELRPGARPVQLNMRWDDPTPLGFVSSTGVSFVVLGAGSLGDTTSWGVADLRSGRLVHRAPVPVRVATERSDQLPMSTLGADGALLFRMNGNGTMLPLHDDDNEAVISIPGAYPIGGPTALPAGVSLGIQHSLAGRALVLRNGEREVRLDDTVVRGNERSYELALSRASCQGARCVAVFVRTSGPGPTTLAPVCVARVALP